jgi:hypothetical protein
MPQKRGEVIERVDESQAIPDIYENWVKNQVNAKSRSLANQEEDDKEEEAVERVEDIHEKAHRRKRGRGAATGS